MPPVPTAPNHIDSPPENTPGTPLPGAIDETAAPGLTSHPTTHPPHGPLLKAMRLGDAMVAGGWLTRQAVDDAADARERNGGFLGHWLIERAGADPRTVAALVAPKLGVGYADLDRFPPDPDAVRLAPADLCRDARLIPWRVDGDMLDVAMVDPLAVGRIDRLRQATGKRIEPWLTFPGEWERACSPLLGSVVAESDLPLVALPNSAAQPETADSGDSSPVVRRVDSWIESAVAIRASDIHWEPLEDRLRVRVRVDGTLVETDTLPRDRAGAVLARLKVMAGMDVTENRRPQDGRFRTTVAGRTIDARLSSMPTVWGEKLVARLHRRGETPPDLRQLGLDPQSARRLEHLSDKPWGMILVAGPTGSGKSTTLSSVLHRLNQPTRNIATLEDPVEHPLPGVNHVAVHQKAGLTFAAGLRSLLRQDPDVLLVGEIRDPETAALAIQAASTGHLLLSTVHANSATGAVGRMVHLGTDRWLLAQCLVGLVGQRLAPLVCDDCADPDTVPDPPSLGFAPDQSPLTGARRGRGCVRCQQRGTRGRMGLFEVLEVDDNFREQVGAGGAEAALNRIAQTSGMRTLADSARDAVRSGRVPWLAVAPLLRGSEA